MRLALLAFTRTGCGMGLRLVRELESQGAVSCYEQEVSGRVRKYYHLTRKGKRLLAEEREQWERYARAINTVLELS